MLFVLYIASIVYEKIGLKCTPKNGTFGTMNMLMNQEVDVIFGPVCSIGTPQTACNINNHHRHHHHCICVGLFIVHHNKVNIVDNIVNKT